MQVRVPTKVGSSYFLLFLLQCRHNLTATLPQPCNKVVTVSIPWFLQPCSKVVVDNLATGLQQGCSKLVTLVWDNITHYTATPFYSA